MNPILARPRFTAYAVYPVQHGRFEVRGLTRLDAVQVMLGRQLTAADSQVVASVSSRESVQATLPTGTTLFVTVPNTEVEIWI